MLRTIFVSQTILKYLLNTPLPPYTGSVKGRHDYKNKNRPKCMRYIFGICLYSMSNIKILHSSF